MTISVFVCSKTIEVRMQKHFLLNAAETTFKTKCTNKRKNNRYGLRTYLNTPSCQMEEKHKITRLIHINNSSIFIFCILYVIKVMHLLMLCPWGRGWDGGRVRGRDLTQLPCPAGERILKFETRPGARKLILFTCPQQLIMD